MPRYGQQPARFNATRDLAREMEDLSEEEDDLDDLTDEIKKRGFNWLIPIGRSFTQHEEKNDADEQSDDDDDDDSTDDDDDDDSPSEGVNNQTDAGEEEDDEEEEQDLDADMADMDEPLNTSLAETEGTGVSDDMDAEDSGDFEEGLSSEV